MYAYTIYHYCAFRETDDGDKQFVYGTAKIYTQPHKDGFYDEVRFHIASRFCPAIATNDGFIITSLTKLSDMYRG